MGTPPPDPQQETAWRTRGLNQPWRSSGSLNAAQKAVAHHRPSLRCGSSLLLLLRQEVTLRFLASQGSASLLLRSRRAAQEAVCSVVTDTQCCCHCCSCSKSCTETVNGRERQLPEQENPSPSARWQEWLSRPPGRLQERPALPHEDAAAFPTPVATLRPLATHTPLRGSVRSAGFARCGARRWLHPALVKRLPSQPAAA
mmetsp:Transcript_11372/g.26256  ORF Transcript_11372/g.26256 Transcript_11372/m.26256 type:complete len:200 (+) Transcript_11372:779-1378(+)